jgi:hypothetical protein
MALDWTTTLSSLSKNTSQWKRLKSSHWLSKLDQLRSGRCCEAEQFREEHCGCLCSCIRWHSCHLHACWIIRGRCRRRDTAINEVNSAESQSPVSVSVKWGLWMNICTHSDWVLWFHHSLRSVVFKGTQFHHSFWTDDRLRGHLTHLSTPSQKHSADIFKTSIAGLDYLTLSWFPTHSLCQTGIPRDRRTAEARSSPGIMNSESFSHLDLTWLPVDLVNLMWLLDWLSRCKWSRAEYW